MAEQERSKAEEIAGGAIFGALASAISYLHIGFPFLPLPYLHFQVAEIAVVMAVLFYGPWAGTLASLEYLIILEMLGQFAPFGPLLAFLGVQSIVFGMLFASKLVNHTSKRFGVWSYSLSSIALSSLIRVPLLTLGNLAYFYLIAPGFIQYASFSLSKFTGFNLGGEGGLFLILAFTALFNVAQLFISIIPATASSTYVLARWSPLGVERYWLSGFIAIDEKKFNN